MSPKLRSVPRPAPDVERVVDEFRDEVARDTDELGEEILERLGREGRQPPVQPRSSGKHTRGA